MIPGASPGSIALFALGIAVGTIAFVFGGGWLYGRYLKTKLQNYTEIQVTYNALTLENWRPYANWQWLVFPFVVLGLLLWFLGLVLFPFSLLESFLLGWGLNSVYCALRMRNLGFVLVNPWLKPMRLLTGEEAARHAARLLRRGVWLLLGWVGLVITGALLSLLL